MTIVALRCNIAQSMQNPLTRRKFFGVAATGAALAVPGLSQAQTEPVFQGDASLKATDFGAKADGTTDDSPAIQKALDQAGKGGGTVWLGRGAYSLGSPLVVPPGVTLRGTFGSVPAHNGFRDAGLPKPGEIGTALLVRHGRGKEEGPAAITLGTNATLASLTVFYPEVAVDQQPQPYPFAIAMRGKNPAVLDVELLNPYRGIDTSTSERHLIRNVHGQPLRLGLWVDAIYDIGRIENVHFNPWFSMHPALFQWQMNHGEAFVFGRTDWQYVLNTFCFGYKTGYRFIKSPNGLCNGNFLGIGADDCHTAFKVDDCAPMGLLVTNGEFVSFHGPDPTMVEVAATNSGTIRFCNCSFWGPCNQIAKVDGTGVVGFSDCTMVQWDAPKKGLAAIQAQGSGRLLVRGCTFQQRGAAIQSHIPAKNQVVEGNLVWE